MQGSMNTESLEEAARRQANLLVLLSLEAKLSPSLFHQVVTQMGSSSDLPRRITWTGEQKALTFEEAKVNYAQLDQRYLPNLVGCSLNNFKQPKSCFPKLNSLESKQDVDGGRVNTVFPKNLLLRHRDANASQSECAVRRDLQLDEISRFARMKTVFGHAQIDDGYQAPVYNVKFDQSGQFIISGGDDGIIKIWDKDTMNLQASLHSHMDVIADLDVSLCNKYLVSSSNDGMIIVWDWKACQKVDTINDHVANVNNVKFFKVTPNKEDYTGASEQSQIQMLISCSEDGTVKIYDEVVYLNNKDSKQQRRQTKSKTATNQTKFQLTLVPDDYRQGARNKKIYTVNVSKDGLVAAGSDKGDVFLWQLDVQCLKKQKEAGAVRFIGSFKKHTKTVFYCEFSPDGKMLFTGSDDGTAKIWKIDDKNPALGDEKLIETIEHKNYIPKSDQLLSFRNNKGDIQTLAQHKEKQHSWQCDSLVWSVFGRYVFGAFSGKQHDEKNHSVIKVWDSFSNQIVQDLAQGNNIKLLGFTFLLAPHPIREEIIMSGSDSGTLCLWNVQTRQLLQTFQEFGAYAYEKLLMNDPKNGKFSPDGSAFIICSEMGTLSLFSCDGGISRYQATRVEQFYQFDNEKHENNIYYEDNALTEPQVCGFSLIPFELQPPSSLIGKYKNFRHYTKEEYDRNYVLRCQLAKDEESFIQYILEESKGDANFGAADVYQGGYVEEEKDDGMGVRIALDSQESDEVNQRRQQAQPRRINPHPRPPQAGLIPQAELRMINPNFDPENDLYDRESDENFEDEGATEQVEEDESMQSVESESQDDIRFPQRGQRRVQLIEESEGDDDVAPRTRATRKIEEEQKRNAARRGVLRGLSSSESENDYKISDIGNGRQTRRQPLRNGGPDSRNQRHLALPSSDDDSVNSDMLNEDESVCNGVGRLTRGKSKNKSKSKGRSNRRSNEEETARNPRKTRKNVSYKEREESYEFSDSKSSQEERKRGSKRTRQIVEDSDDEEMIEQPVRDYTKKLKGDEDYELLTLSLQAEVPTHQLKCEFCRRSGENIIGPFSNPKSKNNNERFYFHQECLEANNHSFYHQQKQKWMNIGKALEEFKRRPLMCDRCGNIGATIKCSTCRMTYHGYLCSPLYLISLEVPRQYQCYACRNKVNNNAITETSIDKSEVKMMKRSTNKEHLLKAHMNIKDPYIPQIDDLVYYFFQGHEKFIQVYNCFFYCGDQRALTFDYPWKQFHAETSRPTLCKVTKISYRFPSNRCMHLLKEFGQAEEVPQLPQIIITIGLMILDLDGGEDKEFFVEFFPSQELPEFLVLKTIFEDAMNRLQALQRENMLIGKEYSHLTTGSKYIVKEVSSCEEIANKNTEWLVLVCNNVTEQRRQNNLLRRQDAKEVIERLNVWQLNFSNDRQMLMESHCLNARIREQICGVILDITSKKEAIAAPFQNRVTAEIAKDYVYLIPGEMWFTLIIERLNGNYYRSFAQVQADLDTILSNCERYNGAEHELHGAARKLIQEIKRNLKGIEFSKDENIMPTPAIQDKQDANGNSMNVSDTKISIPMSLFQRNQGRQQSADEQFLQDLDEGKRTFTGGRHYVEETKTAFNASHFPLMISSSGRNSELHADSGKTSSRRSTRNFQVNQPVKDQEQPVELGRRTTGRQAAATNNIQKGIEDLSSTQLIGKQTRSGRTTKLQKANLRESESEEEYQSDNDQSVEHLPVLRKRPRRC